MPLLTPHLRRQQQEATLRHCQENYRDGSSALPGVSLNLREFFNFFNDEVMLKLLEILRVFEYETGKVIFFKVLPRGTGTACTPSQHYHEKLLVQIRCFQEQNKTYKCQGSYIILSFHSGLCCQSQVIDFTIHLSHKPLFTTCNNQVLYRRTFLEAEKNYSKDDLC